MSRIAICFFGQVKNFDQQLYDSFSTNISNVLVNNDIDYFLVTYNNTHYLNIYHNENHRIDYTSINSFFPFKEKIIVDVESDITKNIDSFVLNILSSFGYADWGSYENSQQCTIRAVRQLYGLYALYQCIHGFSYDKYILVRPDCIYDSSIDEKIIFNTHNFCIPNFSHWGGYNDRFAIVDHKGLEVYCNRYIKLINSPEKYHSERYLKKCIDESKLSCDRFNNFRFRLLRTTGKLTHINY